MARGGAQRHLRFLLACQESAEGRLPVAGRPYLACIVERAGLPLNEEPGPVRRFLVVERRIPFRAFQIGRRVNEENRSLAASVRSHACGCPERRVVLPDEIGKASCRERVCQYVTIWGVAESFKNKIT